MSLTNVWLETLGDGLVRADQIVGVDAHPTPALSGKPSRWLVDVALPVSAGSGNRDGWGVTMLHRTLVQTSQHPGDVPAALARLLAQLDHISAAGVITAERDDSAESAAPGASRVRLRFVPFTEPEPAGPDDHEYL